MFVFCHRSRYDPDNSSMMDEIRVMASDEVQDFLFKHEGEDITKLLLSGKKVSGVSARLIAQQLQGRTKAMTRFPLYAGTRGIIYPPPANLEQSSSQATARFKTGIIKGIRGLDLTMGFGIDSFFMASQATMTCIEPDHSLLNIARHNHQVLGATTLEYHSVTAEEFLHTTADQFDFIYVDPSRRRESRKVFRFSDCSPDITSLVPSMLDKSNQVIIKASPFLDIKMGISELVHVEQVWVISVQNECKEILFVLSRPSGSTPVIHAVDLDRQGNQKSSIQFTTEEERNSGVAFHHPFKYLYEPHAAVLKAGAFRWIAAHYQLDKLAPDSHLYTSEEIRSDFPGKCFEVIEHVHLSKSLRSLFPEGYANIITRNYPLSVEEIKKRTGLKEGGALYLICSRGIKENLIMVARLVKAVGSPGGD